MQKWGEIISTEQKGQHYYHLSKTRILPFSRRITPRSLRKPRTIHKNHLASTGSIIQDFDKGPQEPTERKTTTLIKKSTLPEELCRKLSPTGSRSPRLYGLPKIHKEGVPLRPIAINNGAPTYKLSQHLAGLLEQLTGTSTHHVKYSSQFVHTLNSIRIQPGDLMVSFDIVSLFTNVPILDSLKLLSRHFDKDILSLFKHTLTSTYFCFEGEYCEQRYGVAIAHPCLL